MDYVDVDTYKSGGKKGKGRSKGNKANSEKRGRDPNWSSVETNQLLDLLAEVQCRKQDGNGDGTFHDLEWAYVYNQFGKKRPVTSLQARWKNLKASYSFLHYMSNKNGCRWDEIKHMPDLPSDAWTPIMKNDPARYKKYFNKPFPWYKQVEALYGKSIASGPENITTDPNCSVPRTYTSYSDDENTAAQQELDTFSVPQFVEMMANSAQHNIDPVPEVVHMPNPEVATPTPAQNFVPELNVDPIPEAGATTINEPISAPAPCSQNRKRCNNVCGESSRRTKSKGANNCMEGIAERFLYQQQQRTEVIAQLGQSNRIAQEQALVKLRSLALPMADHVAMKMSLGNTWVRGCFMEEEDNEALKMIVAHAVALFRAGQLPLS